MSIAPLGGSLVNRLQPLDEVALERRTRALPRLTLSRTELCDLELLAVGALSPLEGFMDEGDYAEVVETATIRGGLPFGLPITLAVDAPASSGLDRGGEAALADEAGHVVGVIQVTGVYRVDARREAEAVYGTADPAHPGVSRLFARPPLRVSGPVTVHRRPAKRHPEQRDPAEVRAAMKDRGWETMVGFQTRNPVHRAHEYIQKCALETVDGLLLHPLVGETKADDVPDDLRMKSYRALLASYYPADRTLLVAYPGSMRYAGPREALHHAVVRRNYGCTHFIIGRDHAGVGSYYGPLEAQRYVASFPAEALGIRPLAFEPAFYCRRCAGMATAKTCPHGADDRLTLSGTQVRDMLRRGVLPPPEYSRPEVAAILAEGMAQTASTTGRR